MIYRIDRAGTVLGFHTPIGGKHEQDAAAQVGKNISEVLPPEVAAEAVECINEALETREVVSLEYQLAEDGLTRDYEARLVKGGEHEVIAIVRDVTELKELQRELDLAHRDALQAAGTKGRFLATMSHQIRTPMNGVIGMTNVLLQTKLSPEQREYTAIIRNSGEALLSILDDVLDYSKIEAGKIELGRAPFPLRALLEEITELPSALPTTSCSRSPASSTRACPTGCREIADACARSSPTCSATPSSSRVTARWCCA